MITYVAGIVLIAAFSIIFIWLYVSRNDTTSKTPNSSSSEQGFSKTFSLGRWTSLFWLGIVAFGALNFALYSPLLRFVLAIPFIGVAILLIVTALAVWLYVTGRGRPFGAGIVIGYVLLTVVSSGECTLLVQPATMSNSINGFVLYVIAIFVVGVVGLIVTIVTDIVERVRNRRP